MSSIGDEDLFSGRCLSYTKIISMMLKRDTDKFLNLQHKICRSCILKLKRCYNFWSSINDSLDQIMNWSANPTIKTEDLGDDNEKANDCEDSSKKDYKIEHVNVDEVKEKCDTIHEENVDIKLDSIEEFDDCHDQSDCEMQSSADEASSDTFTYQEKSSKTKCKHCSREFDDYRSFLIHQSEHVKNRTHNCLMCSKKYTTAQQLRRHNKTHTNTLVKCDICQKEFKSIALLTRHIKLHNKPLHLCPACGKTFARRDHLQIHIRRHTGETPYKCYWCQKAYPSHSQLTDHETVHHKKKSLVCSVCNKSFIRPSSLEIHMRTHTGEKPFKCDVCNKAFAQSASLKAHTLKRLCDFENGAQLSECFL